MSGKYERDVRGKKNNGTELLIYMWAPGQIGLKKKVKGCLEKNAVIVNFN